MSNILPFHRSPGGNRLIVLAFTTPLAVPTSTVFYPSIGPKNLPCSYLESKKAQTTVGWLQRHPPTYAKRGTSRLSTLLSYAVLPPRPTENPRCMLVACGTSQVNTPWSAGTSTPEADSTDSLIDLTCSLTTFTELSVAPLDYGSPLADVSCTTSPVQATSPP